MMIDVLHNLPTYLADASHLSDALQNLHLHAPAMPDDWAVLAQQFKETDLAGDVGKQWEKFVKTGQVWAFLIGILFGYLVKTFTTFG